MESTTRRKISEHQSGLVNFLASVDQSLWIHEIPQKFAADPFTGQSAGAEVPYAPYLRKGPADLSDHHELVESLYDQVIPILSDRLNQLHELNWSSDIWKRILSFGFYRHIVFVVDQFLTWEKFFLPTTHRSGVLALESVVPPMTFDEHRTDYQRRSYGTEVLFSIYLNRFYPETILEIREIFKKNDTPESTQAVPQNKILEAWRNRRLITMALARCIGAYFSDRKRVELGVMEAYFSERNFDILSIRSLSKIARIKCPVLTFDSQDQVGVNWEFRKKLGSVNDLSENFKSKLHTFLLESLTFAMPRLVVEDFKKNNNLVINQFKEYPKLRILTCESFPSHHAAAFALGVLRQERNVSHVYHEHNWLNHHYLGNSVNRFVALVDEYRTLGWDASSLSLKDPLKFRKSGSLFPFSKVSRGNIKKNHILHITAIALAKKPEMNGGYGYCQEGGVDYLEFLKKYFLNLSPDTLKDVILRPYPGSFCELEWPLFKTIQKIVPEIQISQGLLPSRDEMAASRLVVIDYQSTSYIEALMIDVPTVFFWDQKNYPLREGIRIYDELVAAEICQTDPIQAAHFVSKIASDPWKWWQEAKTRRARLHFLSQNFGSEEVARSQLLLDIKGLRDE